jgi:cytidylate kinase
MAILTVSRQFGSGSREIIRTIVTTLRYAQVDKEVLLEEIQAMGGKWSQWVEEFDESTPSIWERHDRSFIGFRALLQSILLKYALRDYVVLTGRGANFLLEGIPHAYGIRIVAPQDERIERVSMRDSIDRDTARRLTEKTDKERRGFVHALYGKDASDPQGYDAVFDSGLQTLDEIITVVKTTLAARDALKTDAGQKTLLIRAASAKVKAGLVTDSRLFVPILDVEPAADELVLRGVVRTSDEFLRIVQAARILAEDVPLRIELRYRS